MKSLVLILPLLLLSGCATILLRENITSSEMRSRNRLDVTNIQTGYCSLLAEYFGEYTESKYTDSKEKWSTIEVYQFSIDGIELYVHFPLSKYSDSNVIISDEKPGVMKKKDRKSLQIILGRNYPDRIPLGFFEGNSPAVFMLIYDQKGSLRGHAMYCADRFLLEKGLEQKLSVGTSAKFWSTIKSLGYVITVPVDTATLPIQFLLFLSFHENIKV